VECPDAVGTGKLQLLEKVMEGYVVSDIQGWLVTLLSYLATVICMVRNRKKHETDVGFHLRTPAIADN